MDETTASQSVKYGQEVSLTFFCRAFGCLLQKSAAHTVQGNSDNFKWQL